ncbi:hypothetical protein RND71_013209 [Anisodus tanguticus]|uniref:Uncharacterized protein n=1 Tax=Anisodus tanguticus TaxID=243964 RepID=A0AAE1SGU5_9SOLA|nr:hypothetical protein RND71_013209 [Anisodus tanguticus]
MDINSEQPKTNNRTVKMKQRVAKVILSWTQDRPADRGHAKKAARPGGATIHDEEKVEAQIEEAQEAKEQNIINKRRKSVRFRVVNDDDDDDEEGKEIMKKGVVRIRVVVTQEELKQILNGQLDYSSKDDFLRKIKSENRVRRIRRCRKRLLQDGFFEKMSSSTSWKPVLESIPE